MKTQTTQKIIDYIKKNNKVRPHDLIRAFNISAVAIHKQLKKLQEKNLITKMGRPPLSYYSLTLPQISISPNINIKEKVFINQNYLYISPLGEIIEGYSGFLQWVKDIKQEKYTEKLIQEYILLRKKIMIYFNKDKLIDGTVKLKQTFNQVFIDRLFYQDFYSLPKFGKTRLGQLVLYAKQSQNKKLIDLIINETKPYINQIIDQYKIDAIAFIPPTVPRKIQFLKEYQYSLRLNLPAIDLIKIYRDVLVPQKTLSKLEERIINARESIETKKMFKFNNVLIIDDAVGSGATVNETARKLKNLGLVEKVFAYAVVGSFKGFDVIKEI